jgi:hypothetical protein
VEEAVSKIQSMHGISASSTKPLRFSRFWDNAVQLWKFLHAMEVQCDRFDASDVYQTSLVVSHLLSQYRRGGSRRGLRLAGGKIMAKIFRDRSGDKVD